ASYGPFGVFGTSGPNNLSYRQAALVTNPSLAPRLFTATGQNYPTSLGLPLSPASQALHSLVTDASGNPQSYLGTPVSAGGYNEATGTTEYTPEEARLRAIATSAPTTATGAAAPAASSNAHDKLYDPAGNRIGTIRDGTLYDMQGNNLGA